jgi:hypothetical protein
MVPEALVTDEPGFRPETHSTVDEDALWEALLQDARRTPHTSWRLNTLRARMEALRRERDEWEERWHEIETKVLCHDDALARAEAAEAENAKLREALEFYAADGVECRYREPWSGWLVDNGRTARAALSDTEGEG